MWRVEFAAAAHRDLELLFDHLAETYRGFGEAPEEAFDHAARRIRSIVASADRLALAPHRGPIHEDLAPGLRHVTLDRAIYYFQIEGAREEGRVRILAVFFGTQDHQRRMRLRILSDR
ncbi:type II toxin-antitoxin system RelE/ParE family toxin [Amaricoccus sp.]|uniref:type II toxin-antitoxin system RelE/ParE family toxin n=1 Tax=Amaricoccus sp. TaxID=1872485 RepID=UPI00260F8879|nr:type II toxin-antitoxin system RelE/ParE family toxin [Amaricoccus sp.]HRO10771.1 type II toxin-antitoxin system RelE/ParE family toxin [Amaricoccus sp.]